MDNEKTIKQKPILSAKKKEEKDSKKNNLSTALRKNLKRRKAKTSSQG